MDLNFNCPQYIDFNNLCGSSSEIPLQEDNSNEELSYSEDYLVHHKAKQLSLSENKCKNFKATKTEKKPGSVSDLNTSRKRKYVPMAEEVLKFEKDIPERFHTFGAKAFEPQDHWSPDHYVPRSPKLQTSKRQRIVTVLSREEQEAKEAEEMKRYKFHARPFKGRKGSLPMAHTARKRNTEEKPYEFKARPVPKAVILGPTISNVKVPNITVPKSPAFALKSRAERWSENKPEPPKEPAFKAMPAPSATCAFVVHHEKKSTEVKPFSFEKYDKDRFEQKQKKIQEEIEKENKAYVFKAQPLPNLVPSTLPQVPVRPLTEPEPFNVCSEGKSFKPHNHTDEVMPTFKAQPATVLQKPPFIPVKPPKLHEECKEVILHTELRAAEREKLKVKQQQEEEEKKLLLQELMNQQKLEEEREIRALRDAMVHKPLPVPHFKEFKVNKSTRPLTEPVSPQFKTDERLLKKD